MISAAFALAAIALRYCALRAVSKRSPDEPTGRANARPIITPRHPGFIFMLVPHIASAHAGYLLRYSLRVDRPARRIALF
jgi:hypothetical protein